MPQPPEIEALLAEDGWIRRMARSLASDTDAAEDLAQDAWLAALARPRAAREVRPWLYGVLRNLRRSDARGRRRREEREHDTARGEALPSTAEVVAEVTLRREIGEQLLGLEEPCRTALFLRFFRDLPLKEIAECTDVPLSTAHARVRRGLEQIRQRLDRAHGGDRGAWAVVMPLLAPPPSAPAATRLVPHLGGIVMSIGIKSTASILVAGLALLIFLQVRASRSVEPAAAAPHFETAALDDPSPGDRIAPAESKEREEVPALSGVLSAPPEGVLSPEVPTADLVLRGEVVSESGRPLGGAIVSASTGAFRPVGYDSTDSAGRFTIAGCPAGERLIVDAKMGMAFLREFGIDPAAGDVRLQLNNVEQPPVRLKGTVLGPGGEVLPHVSVSPHLEGPGSSPVFTSDPKTGRFEIPAAVPHLRVPPGKYRVSFRAAGFPRYITEQREILPGEIWDLGVVHLVAGGRIAAYVSSEDETIHPVLSVYDSNDRFAGRLGEGDTPGAHQSGFLAPGRYYVAVGGEHVAPQWILVDVAPDVTTELSVSASPATGLCEVRIAIPADVQPGGQFFVSVHSRGATVCRGSAVIGLSEEYRVSFWLEAGSYEAIATTQDGRSATARFETPESGEDTTVELAVL